MTRRIGVLFTALLALAPGGLRAQSIIGRLVDSTSQVPVVGALVELRSGIGVLLTHAVTSTSGQFVLGAPGAGTYQLRFAAIGYARHQPIDLTVDSAGAVVADIRLVPVVVSLPDVVALGGKRECGKSGMDNAMFASLLDGAQQALEVMQATVESRDVGFDMTMIHRRITGGNRPDTVADSSVTTMRSWPVQSIALDSLEKHGFARPMSGKEGTGWVYYGPDLQVLFSDWFLTGHCFTLARAAAGDSALRLRFEPVHHSRNVDVMGEMVLDRQTLALEQLSFRHIDFPFGSLDGASGGKLSFLRVASGFWIPVDWTLWAPIAVPSRNIPRPFIGTHGTAMSQPSLLAPVSASGGTMTVVGRVETSSKLVRVTVAHQ